MHSGPSLRFINDIYSCMLWNNLTGFVSVRKQLASCVFVPISAARKYASVMFHSGFLTEISFSESFTPEFIYCFFVFTTPICMKHVSVVLCAFHTW